LTVVLWLWCILAAYLIGATPVGVLIGRAKGINIRQHGSRNIGATNVGRVLGKKFGVLCFVMDFLKGIVPVAGAGAVNHVLGLSAEELTSTQMWLWMAVAAAAVLGHMNSMWLRFGGGKGVATGFGAIIAMFNVLTLPALAAVVVWYVALRLSKYVSLASMLAVLTIPVSYLISVIPPHATNQPLATTMRKSGTPRRRCLGHWRSRCWSFGVTAPTSAGSGAVKSPKLAARLVEAV
jgi:glycerol-3-phosphate acyltransferase PlsY